jgi:hypothetical protein
VPSARASQRAGCHAGKEGGALRPSVARNVTFPARQYSVNGERRSFALLRPVADTASQDRLLGVILATVSSRMSAVPSVIGSS